MPEYADFKVRLEKEVFDETHPAGTIISQKPEAGKEVAPGTEIFVVVSKGPAEVDVPMINVVGWEEKQALNALNNLDMNLQYALQEEASDTVPAGYIIRTEPVEGTNLVAGQTVTLVISSGKPEKTIEMMDLVDEDVDAAKVILDNLEMDLEIVIEEIFDSVIKEGNVVKTDPAKGEALSSGQTVTLYVSKGQDLKVIPKILGKNMVDAASLLNQAGFENYESKDVESTEPAGTVVGFETEDGKTLKEGDKVDVNTKLYILISKGPAMVKKNVTIDLKGAADEGNVTIKILRQGSNTPVFEGTVTMGQTSVVLENQEGYGDVYYEIFVHDTSWIQKVTF